MGTVCVQLQEIPLLLSIMFRYISANYVYIGIGSRLSPSRLGLQSWVQANGSGSLYAEYHVMIEHDYTFFISISE